MRRLTAFRLALALGCALVAAEAGAIHVSGVFELDGNTVADVAGRDDADTVFGGSSGALDAVYADDTAEPDATVFKAGNKDGQPVSDWECLPKINVTDKLDLRHGFAAAYRTGGDLLVVFGAERDSNNGNAHAGLWLFQQRVACDPATGRFVGHKTDGDLLIANPFTGGGATHAIDVYRWTDPTPAAPESGDEALVRITGGTGCTATPDPPGHHATDPDVCGVANGAPITGAWSSDPIDALKYVEGGINLTRVFARFLTRDVCYVSFLLETRSSQELAADLEDFIGGDLSTCGSITVNKVTIPAGRADSFAFTVSGGPDALADAFTLTDAAAPHVTLDVRPGTYRIAEAAAPGWVLVGATCSGGPFGTGGPYTPGSDIALGPGESIACTFTNAAPGRISVDKVTVPAGDTTAFDFQVTGPGLTEAFRLTDASAPWTSAGLASGLYAVSETSVPGWTTTAVCAGGLFGSGQPYAGGSTFAVSAGDDVTCTFTNTRTPAGGGSISVAKVTDPSGSPLLFDFVTAGPAITDAFALAPGFAPHVTSGLPPGTYSVTEYTPAGWTASAWCAGGPFGAGQAYAGGEPFILGDGQHVTCTFTNTLRTPPQAQFCPTQSVMKVLAWRRFAGYRAPDVVVRVDLGGSIQAAIDQAADFNGDGHIVIGVAGNGRGRPGGHTTESLVIDAVYPAPFALIACSVTVHDATPDDGVAAVRIAPTAGGPGIFVLGLYATGSGGPGWLVEGDGRYLYSINGEGNGTGIWVVGNDNTIDLGLFTGNAGAGVLVSGDRNTITGVRSIANGGHGIQVTGQANQVVSSVAGSLKRGNGGDGINLSGRGSLLYRNTVHANGGDGIEVSGGQAASPNVVKQNVVGGWAQGNQGHGIFIHNDEGNGRPDPIEVDRNTVRSNGLGGIVITGNAPGHELSRNVSGGKAPDDNGACEFAVAAGNLSGARNQANGVTVPGLDGAPFPETCLGTP
jgi:hypothetical protein